MQTVELSDAQRVILIAAADLGVNPAACADAVIQRAMGRRSGHELPKSTVLRIICKVIQQTDRPWFDSSS